MMCVISDRELRVVGRIVLPQMRGAVGDNEVERVPRICGFLTKLVFDAS